MIWLKRVLKLTAIFIALLCILVYFTLSSSKPTLNAKLITPIPALAQIDRDENGIATFTADSREAIAYALGFVHAEERFFQMDLLRKNSSGELSELFGVLAADFDSKIRLHQFRKRAQKFLLNLPEKHQRILEQYTHGVNAGISNLSVKPFEYLILNVSPKPWKAEDSLLVLYSMYIDLQHQYGQREQLLGKIKAQFGTEVYKFLNPAGSMWDAAIDGTQFQESPLPKSSFQQSGLVASSLQQTVNDVLSHNHHESLPGSNSWVVSGSISKTKSALLANDMHLGIRVPNIWYRAGFRYKASDKQILIDGVTLPGTPAMVVGSNRHVAWGFTNSYGDWSDLVELQLNAPGDSYHTPSGLQKLTVEEETIKIKGAADRIIRVTSSQWGPVVAHNSEGKPLSLRWVAHDAEGINFNLLNLEGSESTQQAIDIAHTMAIPAQNIVVADKKGDIAWTIAGPMPVKQSSLELPDWETPQDWSQSHYQWLGYLNAEEKPTVFNPPANRIWTGNSRVVGNDMYEKIGNGGYALGARSQQIQQGLFALNEFSEQDFLDIQNDNRALFLARWQKLILNELLTPNFVKKHQLDDVKAYLENWQQLASIDSVGYSIVRAFRIDVRQSMFDILLAPLKNTRTSEVDIHPIRHQIETPMWTILTNKPKNIAPTGYADWTEFLEQTLLSSIKKLKEKHGSLSNAKWGTINTAKVQHPLSKAVPALSLLLDMPSMPVAGDSYMPRVQGPDFGASERFVVSPSHEASAILHMPSGQSGHPLSPYYGNGHKNWINGTPSPLLPGKTKYTLILKPL
ncbi:penicillin acylase family protein [Psychrosphaera sp.]|nr:penicillin acylase family protein [Psychrosphaera sp.]